MWGNFEPTWEGTTSVEDIVLLMIRHMNSLAAAAYIVVVGRSYAAQEMCVACVIFSVPDTNVLGRHGCRPRYLPASLSFVRCRVGLTVVF